MQRRLFLLVFCIIASFGMAQDKMTKADKLFYGYSYAAAINQYQKQMRDGKLMTNDQLLNLADSYFHTGDYNNASKIYLDINKKDTIMSVHQFNKMLQSLAKTTDKERVKAFLETKTDVLSNELVENSEFNFELLQSNNGGQAGFEIFNAGCNSPQADFSPAFYKDRILFSSGRPQKKSKKVYAPSGESYLDIYVGKLGPGGQVLNPNTFERIPESNYHKSTPYYAEGLNRIFYILSNTEEGQMAFNEKGKNALAIGMLYPNGQFRFILKDLGTSFYYPFFEESTQRIYFAANFEDSYGGTDIYYVNTNNGQIMSEPFNLGPRINSPGNEIAPYLLNGSLYFSSDIFYGLGGMDIYKSNIQPDGSFSIPINLGSGINSPSDDFGFIIKTEGPKGYSGYFSSNRRGGKGGDDIYGFQVDGAPGLKTLVLRGTVTKLGKRQGVDKAFVRILDADNKLVKKVFTNEDGEYQLEIPWRNTITMEIGKDRYSRFMVSYDEKTLEEIQKTPLNVELLFLDDVVMEKEEKNVLKLNNFLFARGTTELTLDMTMELDKVLDILKEFPEMLLRIESHTDSRGAKATNKRISQKRADVIKKYLLDKGVPPSNIVAAEGHGEEKILNNCKDGVYCLEFLHNQNLRTLFVLENYTDLR